MRDNYAFWRNDWKVIDGNEDSDNDGGEQLGPCEGHKIYGEEVYLYGNHEIKIRRLPQTT